MLPLFSLIRRKARGNPLTSFIYHRLREVLASRRSKAITPYGFLLAGNSAMETGRFEPEEVNLVRELLVTCDRLIDIGANVGLYSCLARSLGRSVLAVEPLSANLRLLHGNLSANLWADTEVAKVALSDEVGESEIFGTDTGASLCAGWAGLSRVTMLRQVVQLSTLDILIAGRFSGERLFIKIDIEGGEYACLKGAVATLAREPAPIWLVEICLQENFPGGVNPNYLETFDVFFSHGYQATTANTDRREVTRAEVKQCISTGKVESGTHNYLFYR